MKSGFRIKLFWFIIIFYSAVSTFSRNSNLSITAPQTFISLILLVVSFVLLIGVVIIINLKDPLRRCPLCKSSLKSEDYKIISAEESHKIIRCLRCNRDYEIVKCK